jgi:hypothetical protein
MTKSKQNTNKQTGVCTATDQQVKLPTSGTELRKGVNVLNTSAADNPAPNPFVLNQANQQQPQNSTNAAKQSTESKK